MSNRPLAIDDQLYRYILDVAVTESPAQKALRDTTSEHPAAIMQIAPDQAQFMALLVKLLSASSLLEIGTFTGYSALSMAQALPEDGKIVCCDVSEEYTDIGKPFWQQAGVSDKIDLRIAPALDTLNSLLEQGGAQQYDLAFIDADKANYSAYYECCLQLVRPGGVILFDNTLWSGHVADPSHDDEDTKALRALNKALKTDERVDIAMLTVADGLTIAMVR